MRPPPPANSIPARFYSLDALRGVAALSVAVYHWQHFIPPLGPDSQLQIDRLPFYDFLFLFFHHGFLAVDLFFMISGFVFFWLYSQKIASGALSAYSFAVLRFSRLYPLHLLTLLLTAGLQSVAVLLTGASLIYSYNDWYHFVLHLFFASHWGLQKGFSFNAPVWSVSIEILLYVFFYLFARLYGAAKLRRGLATLLAFALLILSARYIEAALFRGLLAFLIGGLCFLFYLRARNWRRALPSLVLGGLCIALWILVILEMRLDLTGVWGRWQAYSEQQLLALRALCGLLPVLCIFPLTILGLALIEARRGALGKRLRFLGDISYSSYLLHFPLQLGFLLLWRALAISENAFSSPFFFAAFFAVLLTLSLASYHAFERPLQSLLRARLIEKSKRNKE
ncbi:MAG: acyltransferase [Leptospirales bacterium]|nr:acyltransferase [Leptospirales bacterium]